MGRVSLGSAADVDRAVAAARAAFPALNQAHRPRPENGLQTKIEKRGGGQHPGLEEAKEQHLQDRSARA